MPHSHIYEQSVKGKSYRKLLLSLMLMMFFWQAVVTIILIYNILTIIGILLMVNVGLNGLKHFHFRWLEHNEQLITGVTLICEAILNFFIVF